MITQYILPQDKQNKINELNNRLAEIELAYTEKILKFPFDEHKIRKDFMNNQNVKLIQQAITDIYMKSTTKILITLENEEEIKYFKENWRLKDKTRDMNFNKIPEERIKEIGKNETGEAETSTLGEIKND